MTIGTADVRPRSPQVRQANECPRRKRSPVVVTVGPSHHDRLTEAGAAERFARLHGANVRYDHRRGRWLVWDAHRWKPDADAAITRLTLKFARSWQQDAVDIPDRDRREATFKAAIRLERRNALQSMLAFSRDLRPITDTGEGWNADPWLPGVENGVVDLRNGHLREGRRDDRITFTAGAPYDPEARSDLWDSALRAILVDDALIDFVQVAAGYSTTGDTRRDCWFLADGSGRNGKGTLLHTIRRALGDYALELPASVFDLRRDRAPYDLAVLPGKRFVMSSESGDTIRMHHDRIKQITGGDPMRVANKYERSFECEPSCKLWLSCNQKPRVTDESPAFWARVLRVPFSVSFAGREDRDLRPTLQCEPTHRAAALTWLVVGAVRYHARGLHPPAVVRDATRDYESENDPLADFITEAIDTDPHGGKRCSAEQESEGTKHAATQETEGARKRRAPTSVEEDEARKAGCHTAARRGRADRAPAG